METPKSEHRPANAGYVYHTFVHGAPEQMPVDSIEQAEYFAESDIEDNRAAPVKVTDARTGETVLEWHFEDGTYNVKRYT